MDMWDYIASLSDNDGDLEVYFEMDGSEEEGYAIVEASLLRAIGWENQTYDSYVGFARKEEQRDWSKGKDAEYVMYRENNCSDYVIYLKDGKDLEHFLQCLKEKFDWTVKFDVLELDRPCSYPYGPTLYRPIHAKGDWELEAESAA